VQKAVGMTLRNLARSGPLRPVLAQEGAVLPLISLLSRASDDGVLANAAAALANLALHEGSRRVVVAEGGAGPLLQVPLFHFTTAGVNWQVWNIP
jgi:hypothetical protein